MQELMKMPKQQANRTLQIILAEKFKSIMLPYSGNILSTEKVNIIARKCAKAITGEDEDPVRLVINLKNNVILEKEIEE